MKVKGIAFEYTTKLKGKTFNYKRILLPFYDSSNFIIFELNVNNLSDPISRYTIGYQCSLLDGFENLWNCLDYLRRYYKVKFTKVVYIDDIDEGFYEMRRR